MPNGFERDPHSENGHACPRNFFAITRYAELADLESFYVPKRAVQLETFGVAGGFDIAHLQSIHRYLFQDVFPWAGEFRVVSMSKTGGSPFALPAYIVPTLAKLLRELESEGLLRSLEAAAFSRRAAYYLGEINAVHAFREGNGRTQREFIRQIARQAGHGLSWAGFSQSENVAASILSHTRGDNSGLATIVETAITQAKKD